MELLVGKVLQTFDSEHNRRTQTHETESIISSISM